MMLLSPRYRVVALATALSTSLAGAQTAETTHVAGTLPMISPWMVLPFVGLLLAIAVAPFINRHWWEKNYPYVAAALALVSVGYYLLVLKLPERLLATGEEYVSFIILIGSLFVVAGGILIRLKGRATPLANVVLLGIGAVVSNLVGTTGASMILIRPFLRVNRFRIRPYHVVFFIFVVSNMGGALTPIGDPPLFLGYLRGVPFFWVAEQVWLPWLVAIGMILGVFYVIDRRSFSGLAARTRHAAEEDTEEAELSGLHNILFLVMILVAVFVTHPPFLREGIMLVAAGLSYATTRRDIHRKNEFNFIPIKEVAILFAGIFATMIPALDWLEQNAAELGIRTAGQFYWSSGSLSSFLDNAPTYLNFLSAQIGLLVPHDTVQQMTQALQVSGGDVTRFAGTFSGTMGETARTLVRYHYDLVASGSIPEADILVCYIIANHPLYLQAISLGAVFFGACTYIGNGPNFMVKSIADQAGIETPTFFGYVFKYTLPILLPIFTVIWFLFLRG
jgi:Na+/H+ antiporter NhaD/arsenite permease-like protein